jgi:hypothetical protein
MDWPPPRAKRIEELLRAEFPGSWAPLPITTLTNPLRIGPTPADRAAHTERLARIDARRKELGTLEDAEVLRQWWALQDAATRRRELLEAQREKARVFNLPTASADYVFWVKADHWTLDEAIALLLGKDPRKVTLEVVKSYGKESAFATRYLDLRMLAERTPLMNFGRAMVRQLDVARWIADAQLDAPLGLLKAMQDRYGTPTKGVTPSVVGTPGETRQPGAVVTGTEPAPTVVATVTKKKWTADRLEELSAYRDKHGTKAAAEHFGVTTSRVRELLPTGKPATKGYSAFTHRPK